MKEDSLEEQVEVPVIPKSNAPNLEEQLFQSYCKHKEKCKNVSSTAEKINEVAYALSILWKELMPSSIVCRGENVISFPKGFLENHSNILRGSFLTNIEICKKKGDMFFIYVSGKEFQ